VGEVGQLKEVMRPSSVSHGSPQSDIDNNIGQNDQVISAEKAINVPNTITGGINPDLRIPVITCAEDVLKLQKTLGLTDEETDSLATEIEMEMRCKEKELEVPYYEPIWKRQLNFTCPLRFEATHRDFTSPLKLENGETTFYDCTIEDMFFLKQLQDNPDSLRGNKEKDSPLSTTRTSVNKSSAKRGDKNSSVGSDLDSRNQGGRHYSNDGPSLSCELWKNSRTAFPRNADGLIAWPAHLTEFTLLMDAFERIMQDNAQGATNNLSLRQANKVAVNMLQLDKDFVHRYIKPIYEHWRRRRQLSPTKCLIREFLSPHRPSHEQGTFSAFKPRNKERWAVGVRRHRRPNRDNYKKLLRLARDFVDVVGLMSLVVQIDNSHKLERQLRRLQFLERRREVIDPNYQSPFERKKMNISLIENTSIRRSDIDNTVSTSNSTANGKVLSSLIVDNHQSCSSLVAKTVKGHGLLHHEVNWPVRPLLSFFSMKLSRKREVQGLTASPAVSSEK